MFKGTPHSQSPPGAQNSQAWLRCWEAEAQFLLQPGSHPRLTVGPSDRGRSPQHLPQASATSCPVHALLRAPRACLQATGRTLSQPQGPSRPFCSKDRMLHTAKGFISQIMVVSLDFQPSPRLSHTFPDTCSFLQI